MLLVFAFIASLGVQVVDCKGLLRDVKTDLGNLAREHHPREASARLHACPDLLGQATALPNPGLA
eukprot:621231-Alexandrium_andersonii.AAC.1